MVLILEGTLLGAVKPHSASQSLKNHWKKGKALYNRNFPKRKDSLTM